MLQLCAVQPAAQEHGRLHPFVNASWAWPMFSGSISTLRVRRSLMQSIATWLEEQGGLPLYTVEGEAPALTIICLLGQTQQPAQPSARLLATPGHHPRNVVPPETPLMPCVSAGDEPAQQAAEWSLPGMQPAGATAAQQGQQASGPAPSSGGGSPVPVHRTQSTSSDGSS